MIITVKPQLYDPFLDPCEESLFPANAPASLLRHIKFVWNDICYLFKIRSETKEPYIKKLLLKYIIIEYLSVVKFIQRFNTIIFKATPECRIDKPELVTLKELFKCFFKTHKVIEKKITDIRHNIGAHRKEIDLITINKLWIEIEEGSIKKALDKIPALYNFLLDLKIYKWSKKIDDTFEIVFPFKLICSNKIIFPKK